MAAKQHQRGGPGRVQTESAHLVGTVQHGCFVKLGADDHAAGGVHPLGGVTQLKRLRRRACAAADEVLRLAPLNPEMRGDVGQVGERGDVRHARQGAGQALEHRAVEVGHQRHHQIGLGLQPVLLQGLDQRRVAQPDEALQDLELLRRADGPAARQAFVVPILGRAAGHLAKTVLGVEHIEQVDQPHTPRAVVPRQRRLQRQRRGAVAAAGIEIDQIDGGGHGVWGGLGWGHGALAG